MPSQQRIVSGRRQVPFSQASATRAGARRLPEIYAAREARRRADLDVEFQERGLEQGKEQFDTKMQFEKEKQQGELGFAERKLSMQQKTAKEAAEIAKGGAMFSGGIGLATIAGGKGMFDDAGTQLRGAGDKIRDTFRGGDLPPSGGYDADIGMGAGEVTPEPGFLDWDMDKQELGGALIGGASGGMMAAGMSKQMGTKKKWKNALIGAAGGMAGSWMAGGDDIYSLGLGGILGGGLGSLL